MGGHKNFGQMRRRLKTQGEKNTIFLNLKIEFETFRFAIFNHLVLAHGFEDKDIIIIRLSSNPPLWRNIQNVTYRNGDSKSETDQSKIWNNSFQVKA